MSGSIWSDPTVLAAVREVTRDEARRMAEAHNYHLPPDGLPREGCPECEDRPLSTYTNKEEA